MFENLFETKNCVCGKDHYLITKEFIVIKDALLETSNLLTKLNFKKPLFVFDNNTLLVAEQKLEKVVPNFNKLVLQGEHVLPDENNIELVQNELKNGYDVAVAVGAGVICDTVRYATFKLGMPFISAPTAASVDGFVSDSAAVTLKGAKHTLPAQAPVAIIADLEIISSAPKYLAASGVGDMLSKYISIADWKIGHLLTGEYFCPYVAKLTIDAVDTIVKEADLIATGDINSVEKLMYGLLLSGICMQMTKITRSASSFEHHYSHFLEVIPYKKDLKHALHGEKVGVATLIAAKYYDYFFLLTRNIYEFSLTNQFNIDNIIKKYAKFGDFTKEMLINENVPTITEKLDINLLNKNYGKCLEISCEIPSRSVLEETLLKVNGYTSPTQIGLTLEESMEVLSLCSYIRNRFTMLRLVCDYNLVNFNLI